jgi:hypothetical protein
MANLPLHGFAHNRVWVAIVALPLEVTAWMQLLGLTDRPARRREPKRLRLRLFSIAGRIARHARAYLSAWPRTLPTLDWSWPRISG